MNWSFCQKNWKMKFFRNSLKMFGGPSIFEMVEKAQKDQTKQNLKEHETIQTILFQMRWRWTRNLGLKLGPIQVIKSWDLLLFVVECVVVFVFAVINVVSVVIVIISSLFKIGSVIADIYLLLLLLLFGCCWWRFCCFFIPETFH